MSPSNLQEVVACREQMSALVDGQLSGAELTAAVEAAMGQEEARASWQVYHLIGDVLRAPELAQGGGRDEVFLARISQRLQAEVRPAESGAAPALVVAGSVAANDESFRWKMVAGLATLAAVAVMGWNLWDRGEDSAVQLASKASTSQVLVPMTPSSAGVADAVEVATGTMIRDPRLDELLAAHRQVGGSPVWQDASGFLRNATYITSPER